MGCNTAPATIEFPARFLDDEIRDCLVEYENVELAGNPGELDGLGLVALGDAEVEISDGGIFRLHDSEVCYGFFEELEDLLKKKGIPFDRNTAADWAIIPVDRHFRPGERQERGWEDFDKEFILNPETDEVIVSVKKIRELLKGDPEETETDLGVLAYKKTINLMAYLDEKFPAYRPLEDYVTDLQEFQPIPLEVEEPYNAKPPDHL